ncbi:ATPase domain-containing protein [Marinobacter santoriniensis NKSG1]|uniref:histidine kinase n=1 Tax=Marinobacter santoriniensis NKSG1 TaxID=1288826 RepID=M7CYN7_9GAMM|nr:HAMP domain-containing sensor histidine kinase [Marinobacter santoriniensis]EMP57360.1 ATPase domain-containing protein [Marinobacter santoriniensis NKSG1]
MTMLRSTPLKLTSTLIVIFTLFTLSGFGAAYLFTRASVDEEISADLEQTVQAVRSVSEQDEIEERISEIAASTSPADMLLRYDVPGKPPVGTLPASVTVRPDSIVEGNRLPIAGDAAAGSYLAWKGRVGDGDLTLLVGRDGLDELGNTFALVLLWSLIPALLLATVTGGFVARKARDRLDAIESTLKQLTSGQNAARVPLSGDTGDDLGQIATAVNRMAEAQEASIEALRQVSADIAHDLKTPIQRVAVLLDRLDDGTLDDAAQNTVGAAREETAQIIKTFQTLLQIAQMESGQIRSTFSPVDLAALTRDLAEMYEPAACDSGHRINVEADDPVMVTGDRNLLARLIANLIENALRHAPGGTLTLRVVSGPSPELVVADEGPGIPASERERVLRRLYRMERSRTSEGSGLGLSLVAAIADVHDAELTLGDAGPGLEVRVRFGASSTASAGANRIPD